LDQSNWEFNLNLDNVAILFLNILVVLLEWSSGHAVSSDVDNEKERKDETEKSGGFDSSRRALVAKVVAAVAELLFPCATHMTLALDVEHFPLGRAAAQYQPVIMVKLGEAGLKAVVLHAVLEFAPRGLVVAFYHLRILLPGD